MRYLFLIFAVFCLFLSACKTTNVAKLNGAMSAAVTKASDTDKSVDKVRVHATKTKKLLTEAELLTKDMDQLFIELRKSL